MPLYPVGYVCAPFTQRNKHTGCWAALLRFGGQGENEGSVSQKEPEELFCPNLLLGALLLCSLFAKGRPGKNGKQENSEHKWWCAHVDGVNGDEFSVLVWITSPLHLKEGPSPFLTLKIDYKIRMIAFIQAQITKQEEASAPPCLENNISTHVPRGCCQTALSQVRKPAPRFINTVTFLSEYSKVLPTSFPLQLP